jgi:membrane protein HdeD
MRIISITSGILLVGTGIWCFTNSGFAFLSFAFVLGSMALLSGLCSIAVFLTDMKRNEHDEWRLADGALAVIFGLIVLADLIVTDEIAVTSFGMWLLCSGVDRSAASLSLRSEKKAGWYWGLGFGGLSIIGGICSFINPLSGGFSMVVIFGIVFILQGANIIVMSMQMKKAQG